MTDPELELEVEVFRSGDYGPKGTYGEDDIESIAKGYNPGRHEAPVTLDHAQHGPAHGWVKRLRRIGDRLVATLWKVSPALRDWMRSGAYRKCSVELYRSFRGHGSPYLKAVSFLGAAAPEVKGLQPPVFAENDDLGGEAVTLLSESAPAADPNATPSPEPADLKSTATEPADAEPGGQETRPVAAGAPPTTFDRELARALVQATFASLKRSGRFLPAWEKIGIEVFAEFLMEFQDRALPTGPEGVNAAPNPWQWFLEFLETLPHQVTFGEFADPVDDTSAALGRDWTAGIPTPSPRSSLCPRSVELHRETIQFMNQNPGVAYAEALHRVARR